MSLCRPHPSTTSSTPASQSILFPRTARRPPRSRVSVRSQPCMVLGSTPSFAPERVVSPLSSRLVSSGSHLSLSRFLSFLTLCCLLLLFSLCFSLSPYLIGQLSFSLFLFFLLLYHAFAPFLLSMMSNAILFNNAVSFLELNTPTFYIPTHSPCSFSFFDFDREEYVHQNSRDTRTFLSFLFLLTPRTLFLFLSRILFPVLALGCVT